MNLYITLNTSLNVLCFRCNFLYGTPTMYIDMLGQPDLHNYDLSSVESGERFEVCLCRLLDGWKYMKINWITVVKFKLKGVIYSCYIHFWDLYIKFMYPLILEDYNIQIPLELNFSCRTKI